MNATYFRRRRRHGLEVRLGDDGARRRDAGEARDPARGARPLGAPDARRARGVHRGRGGARRAGLRRRCGRRGASRRSRCVEDAAAGARRPDGNRARRARLPALDGADACRDPGRHARDRACREPSTPHCSLPRSSRARTKRSRAGSRTSARSRPARCSKSATHVKFIPRIRGCRRFFWHYPATWVGALMAFWPFLRS